MNIDDMARLGYNYAINGGKLPNFSDDMDLMAFNAGISNANIREGCNAKPIAGVVFKSHEGRSRAGHKELQTIWGGN